MRCVDVVRDVKMQIRSCAIGLKCKNKAVISDLTILTQEYNEIMNKGNLANVDHCYLDELSSKIEKGQELLEEDLRMKAGVKWREEGERSSKFFLNLIKQRTVASSMKG